MIYTSTAARVAAEMGVSESYVKRAAKYARGVDAAEEAVPGAKNEILSGKLKATDAKIIALAQLSKGEIHAALDELRKPKSERPPKNRLQKVETTSEVQNISESNESAEPPVAEDKTGSSDDVPLNFRKSIQGHRRELTAPERKRLQKSIDNRFYRPKKCCMIAQKCTPTHRIPLMPVSMTVYWKCAFLFPALGSAYGRRTHRKSWNA